MKLYCPHCGVKGSADDSHRGKNVKCPKCMMIFIATEIEWQAEGEDAPAPSMPVSEQPATEVPGDVRGGEAIADETEVSAAQVPSVDEFPAGGTGQGPEETATVEEGVADTAVDREEVLDWSDIVSEIDARETDDENRDCAGTTEWVWEGSSLFVGGVQ